MVSELVRAHVFASGRVQGVFFRASTAERAAALGLAGWIRNTSDGRVEATFEGSRDSVENMLRWCHTGPQLAEVDHLEISWEEPQHERGFHAR